MFRNVFNLLVMKRTNRDWTIIFSSALSRLTSRIPTCCASLVRSTDGLVSAFFLMGRLFGTSRPCTCIRTPKMTRVVPNWESPELEVVTPNICTHIRASFPGHVEPEWCAHHSRSPHNALHKFPSIRMTLSPLVVAYFRTITYNPSSAFQSLYTVKRLGYFNLFLFA